MLVTILAARKYSKANSKSYKDCGYFASVPKPVLNMIIDKFLDCTPNAPFTVLPFTIITNHALYGIKNNKDKTAHDIFEEVNNFL